MRSRVVAVVVVVGLLVVAGAGAQEVDKARVQHLWSMGAELYHDGSVAGAIRAWQELLKLDPGNTAVQERIDAAKGELAEQPVVRVVDSTHLVVKLEDEEASVRLLGVDVTGKLPPTMTAEQAEAAGVAALKELCEGKSVYVMGASDRRRRDRDGSVRGSVFVAPDLAYVNGELLRRGVARYGGEEDPYVRDGLLQAYEEAGQAAQAGMWQGFKPLADPLALPPKYRSNGRLMVPLRELVEWMDAKLTVEPNGRIICANPDVAIKAFATDLESEINGRGRVLDRPMEVRGDTMFVPVQMLACPARGEARSLPHGEVYFKFKERWTLIP